MGLPLDHDTYLPDDLLQSAHLKNHLVSISSHKISSHDYRPAEIRKPIQKMNEVGILNLWTALSFLQQRPAANADETNDATKRTWFHSNHSRT
jgi:hypothetical protein